MVCARDSKAASIPFSVSSVSAGTGISTQASMLFSRPPLFTNTAMMECLRMSIPKTFLAIMAPVCLYFFYLLTQSPKPMILDPGYWILDAGYQIIGIKHPVSSIGHPVSSRAFMCLQCLHRLQCARPGSPGRSSSLIFYSTIFRFWGL